MAKHLALMRTLQSSIKGSLVNCLQSYLICLMNLCLMNPFRRHWLKHQLPSCLSQVKISLLNCDVKILAKALALRLETTIHDVISADQTGFILGRHSFTNIRRLLNIIHSPASSTVPEVVIMLDAEKAFVEWVYLFTCLKKFGYGPNFISWIKLIYLTQSLSNYKW